MNRKIHLIANTILLFTVALAGNSMIARADIWLDYCRANGDPNGSANVAYNTGAGVNQIVELDGGTVSYAPNGNAGLYAFTATSSAPGGNMVSTSINEVTGVIEGSAVSIDQIWAFGNAGDDFNNYFYDTVTFHNGLQNAVTITVHLRAQGTISASATGGNSAHGFYHVDLDFGGNGHGGGTDLEGEKHTNGSPGENYDTYTVSGWANPGESYQIFPAGPGLYGWDFTGTTTIEPGDTVLFVTSRLIALAQASGAQNGSSSAASDFTSTLQLELPPGVTFTSESGHFLAGRFAARPRPSPHPRPRR